MDLRQCRYFLAVARALSFSQAARELHVAQSAVSQAIMDLEDALGAQLLARTRHKVALTQAGEVFARDARELLARADAAREAARRAATGDRGRLVIGFIGSAVTPFLAGLIQAFRKPRKEVAITLRELSPTEQARALHAGEIDLAFTRPLAKARSAGIAQRTLYTDRLVAAMCRNHPLAKLEPLELSSLAEADFVQFARDEAPELHGQVLALCARAGFAPRVVSEPDQMQTVLTLLEAGLGVSLVPSCVRNLVHGSLAFRTFTPASSPVPLVMAWREGFIEPVLSAFLEETSARLPAIRSQMEPAL